MSQLARREQTPDDAPADATTAARSAVVARDGTRAEVVSGEASERLRVLDGDGALLFEYDPASRKARLHVPVGDLELSAPRGHIDLRAGGRLRCFAAGDVSFDTPGAIDLRAHGPRGAGVRPSALHVAPGDIRLGAEQVELAAERARFRVADGHYEGKRLGAVVERAHLVVDTLETVAERVLSRAGSLFQRVRELHEMKSGRLRAVVRGALDLSSESATLIAQKDVRLDGEKINLG